MTPFEENFIREIRETIHTSADFREAVKDGLTELMGEAPTEILIMSLGDAGFRSPAQFVGMVSEIIGQGAPHLYSAILRTAEDPAWLAERATRPVQNRARTGGLDPNEVGRLPDAEKRTVYLHDHRDPDEFSEEDPH